MGYNEGINMHWERSYFAMNKPNIAVASLIYGDPGIPGFNYTNAVLRRRPSLWSAMWTAPRKLNISTITSTVCCSPAAAT